VDTATNERAEEWTLLAALAIRPASEVAISAVTMPT
jgi:hypothetical protein